MPKFTHRFSPIAQLAMLLALFISESRAFARDEDGGGWISSGGENIKDGRNPWFVKNVKDVSYCIDFSVQEISISQTEAQKTIEDAIAAWKKDISFVPAELNDIGLGAQTFHYVPCAADTDIIFQFGYQTLTEPQRKFLGRTDDYFGIAVRTNYDKTQLRGRGFVFINSDLGENASQLAKESNGIWNKQPNLFTIIAHEMGHIFGIPHTGTLTSIMSEGFPEYVIKNSNQDDLFRGTGQILFFAPSTQYIACLDCFSDGSFFDTPAWHWLSQEPETGRGLFHVTFDDFTAESGPTEAKVYRVGAPTQAILSPLKTRADIEEELIGTLTFNKDDWEPVDILRNLVVKVELNPNQNVFDFPAVGNSILGPFRISMAAKTVFRPIGSMDTRNGRLKIGPIEDFELFGVNNGEIIRVLKFIF